MTGYYDIHTHFLPNVDDGSKSMEETVRLLKKEYAEGIRTIYATSHYRRGMFEPDRELVKKQLQLVSEEAGKIGEDFRILSGCEFHANYEMEGMLKEDKSYTLGESRCVLIEFSDRWDYQGIKERCYALRINGYDPIIAHAERYKALYGKLDRIEELIELGSYIQVNAGSILGDDGFSVKRFCKKLMKQDFVHFVGSDGHNMTDRKPQMGKCMGYIEKTMGKDYVKKIFWKNPKNIIEEGR